MYPTLFIRIVTRQVGQLFHLSLRGKSLSLVQDPAPKHRARDQFPDERYVPKHSI